LLTWLEGTRFAQWLLVSTIGWPVMLSAHAIGLAIVVGIVIALNLRMLGLYGTIPLTSLHELMQVAWVGVAINLVTGLALFTTQATTYVTSLPFLLKIGFVVLGCANLTIVQRTLRRDGPSWEANGAVPPLGRALAGSSLFFWVMAVVAGRLIAYV
jgi:hypothetical protein